MLSWSILQSFWPALSDNRSWKPILVFILSGRLIQVLLYTLYTYASPRCTRTYLQYVAPNALSTECTNDMHKGAFNIWALSGPNVTKCTCHMMQHAVQRYLGPRHEKISLSCTRTTKTPISLRIHAVWSAPLLFAIGKVKLVHLLDATFNILACLCSLSLSWSETAKTGLSRVDAQFSESLNFLHTGLFCMLFCRMLFFFFKLVSFKNVSGATSDSQTVCIRIGSWSRSKLFATTLVMLVGKGLTHLYGRGTSYSAFCDATINL